MRSVYREEELSEGGETDKNKRGINSLGGSGLIMGGGGLKKRTLRRGKVMPHGPSIQKENEEQTTRKNILSYAKRDARAG